MLHFSYCIESHSSPMSARPTTSPSVFLEGQNDSREASKDLFTKNLGASVNPILIKSR